MSINCCLYCEVNNGYDEHRCTAKLNCDVSIPCIDFVTALLSVLLIIISGALL